MIGENSLSHRERVASEASRVRGNVASRENGSMIPTSPRVATGIEGAFA